MHLRKFGYVRVSSRDQNEDRQIIEMEKLNIRSENIYTDKQSGKDFNRPRYLLMLNKLCAGDILFVKSITKIKVNGLKGYYKMYRASKGEYYEALLKNDIVDNDKYLRLRVTADLYKIRIFEVMNKKEFNDFFCEIRAE